MNFLLGLLGLIGAVVLGVAMSAGYKRRLNFLSDMGAFLQVMQNNCSFMQNSVKQVLADQKGSFGEDFGKFLGELETNLDKRDEFLAKWQAEQKIISKDEAEFVANFFLSVGKLDSFAQIDAIKNSQSVFEEKLQQAKKLVSTKGMLSVKLSIIVGIGVFIICV